MKLLVATRNRGKLTEIRRGLADCGWEVAGLDSFPDLPEIVEDGETFEENACKKARTVAHLTGELTLADDSGLAVDALKGEPGVRSARYAGEQARDIDNNRLLLSKLGDLPASERKAAFHCVMALCSPAGDCRTFTGEVHGQILAEPRGDQGFGYDPLFFVPSQGRTMAELPLELKNSISHRGAALRQVIAYLVSSGRTLWG